MEAKMMTENELFAIYRRHNSATPGPYQVSDEFSDIIIESSDESVTPGIPICRVDDVLDRGCDEESRVAAEKEIIATGEFLAESWADIASLRAHIDALAAENARLREELSKMEEVAGDAMRDARLLYDMEMFERSYFENATQTSGPCVHCGEGIAKHRQHKKEPDKFVCSPGAVLVHQQSSALPDAEQRKEAVPPPTSRQMYESGFAAGVRSVGNAEQRAKDADFLRDQSEVARIEAMNLRTHADGPFEESAKHCDADVQRLEEIADRLCPPAARRGA